MMPQGSTICTFNCSVLHMPYNPLSSQPLEQQFPDFVSYIRNVRLGLINRHEPNEKSKLWSLGWEGTFNKKVPEGILRKPKSKIRLLWSIVVNKPNWQKIPKKPNWSLETLKLTKTKNIYLFFMQRKKIAKSSKEPWAKEQL